MLQISFEQGAKLLEIDGIRHVYSMERIPPIGVYEFDASRYDEIIKELKEMDF